MTPIRNVGGKITGFVKILRDRTRAKAAEIEAAEERRAVEILNRPGSALAVETDLHRLVQIVTDAGVDLKGAELAAFFYNVLDDQGESYTLYTLSDAPIEAFSNIRCRVTQTSSARPSAARASSAPTTSPKTRAMARMHLAQGCRRAIFRCVVIWPFLSFHEPERSWAGYISAMPR